MKELLLNSFVTLIYKVASVGIKVLLVILITNKYGAEEYGAYTFALSIFLFVNTIFRFGFDIHLHRKIAEIYNFKNKLKCQLIYVRILFISLVSLLIVSILIKLGISLFSLKNVLKYQYLDVFLFYSIFYSSFWLLVYYYRGLNKGKVSVIVLDLIFPFLNVCFIYILNIFIENPVYILVNSFGISVLLCFLILIILDKINFVLLWSKRPRLLKDKFRFEISQSMPYLFISVSGMLLSWVDFYIISFFETDAQLGIYSVVTRISLLLLFPAAAISIFFSNKVVYFLKESKKKEIINYLVKISIGLFIVSLIIFITINTFSVEILSLFGKEFKVAASVLLILSFAHFLNACTGVFETIILMSDSKKYLFKLNLLIVTLNLTFNIPLVYYYGIYGAAFGTLLSIIVNKLLQFVIIKREILSKELKY